MKLTTTTMVTVDGVLQGLDGPDEDRRCCPVTSRPPSDAGQLALVGFDDFRLADILRPGLTVTGRRCWMGSWQSSTA